MLLLIFLNRKILNCLIEFLRFISLFLFALFDVRLLNDAGYYLTSDFSGHCNVALDPLQSIQVCHSFYFYSTAVVLYSFYSTVSTVSQAR